MSALCVSDVSFLVQVCHIPIINTHSRLKRLETTLLEQLKALKLFNEEKGDIGEVRKEDDRR